MTTIGVFLEHSHLGKSTQDQPYTARAHSRYIQRQSATQGVYTHLMPDSYKARQRWFFDHENRIRKNGRIIDKFIIAIPHEISQKDAARTLLAFGKSLGRERAPFMFTLQGFDTNNHHAHFIFIDRDYETGKRIYGTTERNSTRGLKLEWERVANQQFAELGYDVRIQVKDGIQAENDNHIGEPTDMAKDPLPDDAEETGDGDYDVAKVTSDLVGVDPASTVKFLHDQVAHRESVIRHREKLSDASRRHAYLEAERQKLEAEASQYEVESLPDLIEAYNIKNALNAHIKEDGSLKGHRIGVFGYTLFKTAARKEAEQAEAAASHADTVAADIEYTKESYKDGVSRLFNQAQQAERAAYEYRGEIETIYGSIEMMNDAETMIAAGIADAAQAVTLEQSRALYELGELTDDEYRTYLHEAGYYDELNLLEESLQNGGLGL